jgi:tryptophan-rich sensory protein
MAALILILAITAKQYEMYKINNNKNTKKLFTAFSVLAISHILFMFVAHSEAYVAAEIVQLIGYLILLIALIYTLKHGKKEKQD